MEHRWDRQSIKTDRQRRAQSDREVERSRAACGANPLPIDAAWEKEIEMRDEQIRILKQQLLALGEQPVEKIVTLEVLSNSLDASVAAANRDRPESTLSGHIIIRLHVRQHCAIFLSYIA